MKEKLNVDLEKREDFSSSDIQVVVLAGGEGTRLRFITKDLFPKALVELSPGVKAIDQLIDGLCDVGFKDYLFCLGNHHEQLIDHLSKNRKVENLKYTIEKKLLGTGGALMLAIDQHKIDKPILIITSDAIFPYSKLPGLVGQHQKDSITWAVSSSAEPKMVEHLNYLVKYSDNSIVGHFGGNWINEERIENICGKWNIGVFLDGGHGIIDPVIFRKEFEIFQKKCNSGGKVCLYKDILPMISERNRRRQIRGQASILNAYDEKDTILDFGRLDRLVAIRKKLKDKKDGRIF